MGFSPLRHSRQDPIQTQFPDVGETSLPCIHDCAVELRRIGSSRSIGQGRRLHRLLAAYGYDRRNTFVANLIVQMYAACESMREAKLAFDAIEQPNVFSWNILMSGFAQNRHLQRAVDTFKVMPIRNVVSWNSLLAMFSQEGLVEQAKGTFERMPHRDVVSWNAMSSAYAQSGHLHEAKSLFCWMPKRDIVSWNGIITASAKSAKVETALTVFKRMPMRNLVSWSATVAAYAQNGCIDQAKALLDQMPEVDIVSTTSVLLACADAGNLEGAQRMFEDMPVKDVVAWTTMVNAYAQNGQPEVALLFFKLMDLEGVRPNMFTFVGALEACSKMSSLTQGNLVHESIIEHEECLVNSTVTTALLNMYGKCGNLATSKLLFDAMQDKDVVSWNALMAAYARSGLAMLALVLFEAMLLEGIQPDSISLMSVLYAASHVGMTGLGRLYFVSMKLDFGVDPQLDHYVSMVDLLGRAGMLEQAEELVKHMPFEPDDVSWKILLGCSKTVGDPAVGGQVADSVFELDGEDASVYMLLAQVADACQ